MSDTRDIVPDENLHVLFRQFLVDHNPAPLVRYLEVCPTSVKRCGHEYPFVHRLCDFSFGSQAFRVCRCISCGERLFILTDSIIPSPDRGVPYELSGSGLEKWVRDEKEHPAKGPQDWSQYLDET